MAIQAQVTQQDMRRNKKLALAVSVKEAPCEGLLAKHSVHRLPTPPFWSAQDPPAVDALDVLNWRMTETRCSP